jgi:hypothetical protein
VEAFLMRQLTLELVEWRETLESLSDCLIVRVSGLV